MKKILIAEDDAVSRKILERTLDKWGYEVIVTEDGLQAWDEISKKDIRFAVLDWMMPGMDGVDLCRKIRETKVQYYTYIVLLTAKGQKSDIVTGLESGADDYIVKPFDPEELRSRLNSGKRIIELEDKIALKMEELQKANRILNKDLMAASQIQQSMLPSKFPENKSLEIAFKFIPCDEVGGDMINIFELNPDHIGVYISDVSGHGVSAAMYAVAISRILSPLPNHSSICRTYEKETGEWTIVEPEEVMARLNQQLQDYAEISHYATMTYGILNTKTLEFRYVRAGHTPVLLIHDGHSIEITEDGNLPVGISSEFEFKPNQIQLTSGDRLYLYSDGLIQDDKKVGFVEGLNAMKKVLEDEYKSNLGGSLEKLEILHNNISTKRKRIDDVTVLAIEVK